MTLGFQTAFLVSEVFAFRHKIISIDDAPMFINRISFMFLFTLYLVVQSPSAFSHQENVNDSNSIASTHSSSDEEAQQTQDDWGDEWGDSWEEGTIESNPLTVSGFAEIAVGERLDSDPAINTAKTLRDARVQVRADYALSASTFRFRGDLYYDGVKRGWESQLRELAWQGSLSGLGEWGERFDVKIGQQVLTWGTGDYLFLNDLFPKDFQSFFAGRDDEYLKAPSASIKLSGYFDMLNMDVVITPSFEPDIGITGEVFSFFSPQLNGNIAPAFSVTNDNTPSDEELAMRLYGSISQAEVALYGYRGYTKQPVSADENGLPRYSRMNAYGASVLMPLGAGIANAEYVYYDSIEDPNGSNPLVMNAQSRYLIGYTQELFTNVTGGAQWYTEVVHDHDALINSSPFPAFEQERYRHWVTTRITYMALRQTLMVNAFLFYSPTDSDGYLKANVTYSPGDTWQLRSGINLFKGNNPNTFWGQFEDASNAYVALRYFY